MRGTMLATPCLAIEVSHPQAGECGHEPAEGEDIEHVCRTLLRRWGVVFWKLLEREADWLPP